MDINMAPDPGGPLAQQAVEQVRAIFSARLGELDDSHQVWNQATSTAVGTLLTPLAEKLLEGLDESDAETAVQLVADWTSTYLGAFGLIATQLLHAASSQAWVERNPGKLAPTPLDVAEGVDWSERITWTVFASLTEEGRTIV